MLTSIYNQRYAAVIAGFFCEKSLNKAICKRSVRTRVNLSFNDAIFENWFIPYLDDSRFKRAKLAHAPSSEGYIKWVLSGEDILTGETWNLTIDGIPGDKRNNVEWVFGHINNWWGSQNNSKRIYFLGVVSGFYIIRSGGGTPYGIVFSSTPEGAGGGVPPGSVPAPPLPPQGQEGQEGQQNGGEDDEEGFDIKKLLLPALLAAAYFLIG